MSTKFILALLGVMLTIILIFTAFGIAYSPNNFFDTILTVERGLGSFSSTFLNAFNALKDIVNEWLPKVADAFSPLIDIFKSIGELLDKLGVFETLGNVFDTILFYVGRILDFISAFFHYVGEYGFNFTDEKWRSGLSIVYSCFNDEMFFYEDGNTDRFDYSKSFKYVDAFVYDKNNEFSYSILSETKDNITKRKYPNKNTVCFFDPLTVNRKFINAEYWFVTVDLSVPDDYCAFLPDDSRSKVFFAYNYIPVGSSNMVYEYEGYEYYLTGFRLDPKQEQLWSWERPHGNIIINGCEFYTFFEFSFIVDGNVVHSVWISATDYFNDLGYLMQQISVIYDEALYRSDENDRYAS